MQNILGIHHITAIAGDPRRNYDFYTRQLGLRLVKQTVNFDDPGSYHLYYGDASGRPGTILTFFAWPDGRPGRPGAGQATTLSWRISPGSLSYWRQRLAHLDPQEHQGALRFRDPDGLGLELREGPDCDDATPWPDSPVPAQHQLRGFNGVELTVRTPEGSQRLLKDLLGAENDQLGPVQVAWQASFEPARDGVGTFHHVAWRLPDEASALEWRARIEAAGQRITPLIDRSYFRSLYFREPGHVLYEIATDPPGFAIDETPEELGSSLRLPPWLEPQRGLIEQVLPPLQTETTAR